MSILNLVNVGIVLGIVTSIQILKSFIDKKRTKQNKKPLSNDFWILIVWVLGFVMAFISTGINGLSTFNIFIYIKDSFLYAAAASFVYKNYDKGKRIITKG